MKATFPRAALKSAAIGLALVLCLGAMSQAQAARAHTLFYATLYDHAFERYVEY